MRSGSIATSAALLAFAVAACATPQTTGTSSLRPATYSEARTLPITVQTDPHDGMTRVRAPLVERSDHSYLLRAWRRGDETPSIQLYVSAKLRHWAFLDRAHSEGERLNVTRVSREVGYCGYRTGCSLYEDVAINLSPDDLRRIAEHRLFSAKIAGPQGNLVIHVPSEYFQRFLDRLDEIGWTAPATTI